MRLLIVPVALLLVAVSSAQTADITTALQKKMLSSSFVVNPGAPALLNPVTLKVTGAPLLDVLKAIMASSPGLNLVIPEDLHNEKITIYLSETPLQQAIDLVVRAAGLAYQILGNALIVASAERLEQEVGIGGHVIQLKYIPASEALTMLGPISTKISTDKAGNRLILFGSMLMASEVDKVIRSIDVPPTIILLETRLIEVSYDKTLEYGIKWNQFSPVSTMLDIKGGPLNAAVNIDDFIRLPSRFKLALDMMLEDGDARIIMDSKLATTNMHEAKMHVGEVIPYKVQTYNPEVGGGASVQIQEKNTGFILSITPYVNENRQVTLQIEPEVSIAKMGVVSDVPPTIAIRKANTTIRVEDRQTVFIAGLIWEQQEKKYQKVPFLGSIPILGIPFRHTREITVKKNLIIEVTPRIIQTSADLSVHNPEYGVVEPVGNEQFEHNLSDYIKNRYKGPGDSLSVERKTDSLPKKRRWKGNTN